jgi:hypothetical protein
MTMYESALSDLAARLAGTDATLATSLRDILSAAIQESIEAEMTSTGRHRQSGDQRMMMLSQCQVWPTGMPPLSGV